MAEIHEIRTAPAPVTEIFREQSRKLTLGKPETGKKSGNFDAEFIRLSFTAANTAQQFPHTLGRTPIMLIQVNDLLNGSISGLRIESTNNPDSRFIYLKCSEAKPVMVILW